VVALAITARLELINSNRDTIFPNVCVVWVCAKQVQSATAIPDTVPAKIGANLITIPYEKYSLPQEL
jgi:hypothetical protein